MSRPDPIRHSSPLAGRRVDESTPPTSEGLRLAVGQGGTACLDPLDHTVADLFEARARDLGDQVALIFEGRTLTYAELNARSNRLARRLQDAGVRADAIVGLETDEGFDTVVGALGILKAGGAYVAFPRDLPRRHRDVIHDDAGLRIVVVSGEPSLSTTTDVLYVAAGADIESCEPLDAENPERDLGPDHLAYVTFTSGSTGRPKGVLTPHRALVNHTYAFIDYQLVESSDRFLQFSPLSFDASASTLYPALLGGAALVLARTDALHSMPALLRLCATEGVTILNLTVPFARELADYVTRCDHRLPKLRMLVTGGETPDLSRLGPLARLTSNKLRYLNAYGPTEATISTTVFIVPDLAGVHPDDVHPPIGKPLPNVRVLILDQGLRPVQSGAAGELYVGGLGLARGYLKRPELTEKAFVRIHVEGFEERMYRTGDVVRARADGHLEFLGRTDDQVKVRGVRIEPREIESVLERHPRVKDCAVVPQLDSRRQTTLCAFVVPKLSAELTTRDLRLHLLERLPSWSTPSNIRLLDELPLSSNGKVDRHALSLVRPESPVAASPESPTDLPWERELVAIFEEVLDRRPIRAADSFFDLGGDSLSAVHLVTVFFERYGRELPPSALARGPTVAELAEYLRSSRDVPGSDGTILIQPGAAGRIPLFCVPGFPGHPLGFLEFARCSDTERPVYAVEFSTYFQDLAADVPEGSDGIVSTTIEAMSARVRQAIRKVRPHGPYGLIGYSFGGLLAFEIAKQLTLAGETVATLVLLDTPAPGYDRRVGLLRRTLWHLRHARDLGVRQSLRCAWDAGVGGVGRCARFLRGRVERREQVAEPARSESAERVRSVREHAIRTYRPTPYSGRLHVMRAEKLPVGPWAGDPIAGWHALAIDGVDVEHVTGSHLSILRHPNVRSLAARIRELLGSFESGAPPVEPEAR